MANFNSNNIKALEQVNELNSLPEAGSDSTNEKFNFNFNSNNIKALELVNNWKDEIYSFLEAKPDSPYKKFNHIYTNNNSDRNKNNGFANFVFQANVCIDDNYALVDKFNIRIETNVFMGRFQVAARKVNNFANADYIIFGTGDTLYVSDRKANNNHDWLFNKELRNRTDVEINGKLRTFYTYNLNALLKNHKVFCIIKNEYKLDKRIVVCTEDLATKFNEGADSNIYKTFNYYDIDTSNIKYVQYDPRLAQICFYGFKGYKYTNNRGTVIEITNLLSDYADISQQAIYQRLNRALTNTVKTGKVKTCVIPMKDWVRNDISFDSSILNENNEVEVYLSQDPDFDIEENKHINKTEDMKEYQKNYGNMYRKVKKYKLTHTEPRASWTDEEKELFYKIEK